MAKSIVLQCARCGQDFSVKAKRSLTAKHCSRQCQFPPQPDRPCETCGANIPRKRLFKKESRYCSLPCAAVGQKGNHKPMEDRFWKKVDKTPGQGPNGDCWMWISPVKDKDGYGGLVENGKLVRAHVYSYRLHKGPVPKGAFVCHSCDNPSCVRSDHLWLGNATSNNLDKMLKGRQSILKGERAGNAKLTEKQVREILVDDRTQAEIGASYGVSRATIGLIKTGKNWKHLTP